MATQRTKKTAKKSISRLRKLRRPRAAARRHRGGSWDFTSLKVTKKTKPVYLAVGVALVAVFVGFQIHNRKVSHPAHSMTDADFKKLPLIERKFVEVAHLPMNARLAQWSEILTHAKEAGQMKTHLVKVEGAPSIDDTAPLIPEKFNCTTFVESVVALARSASDHEFFKHLIQVRYKNGVPTYLSRNHFPEADWIPNNASSGVLSDQTVKVANHLGVKSDVVSKEINRGVWLDKEVRAGHVAAPVASKADASWKKPVGVNLPFVPVADVKQHADRIPSGVIANIVRSNHKRQPVLITHQGFVFQENGTTWFRHSTPHGDVKTVNFVKYLESIEKKSSHDWQVVGINFNQVHE
jgi:hypothetical protein